ncbi:MAG: extracellular solute-binding protein [Lachnospiraceae bacterium]|nr:extracellular solute-binding protein [Lachnospiraceae bacterium]
MKVFKKTGFIVLLLVFALVMPAVTLNAARPKLSKSKLTLTVGSTKKLKLKNATGTVTWSTSSKKIAKVSKKGVVTAKKAGTAVITATNKGKKYTCTVTVVKKDNKPQESILSQTDNFELTLWDIAVFGDANRVAYDQALKDMKEKYPYIGIREQSFENETYKSKIRAAVAAGELPDIFFTWSGSFLGDFVDAGEVYCLDDALKVHINNGAVTDAALCNSTYNGKHYGVPTTYNVVTLFANMDLLKSVGYDHIPATAEELEDCCDKLMGKGITPFGCSAKEYSSWCISEYLEPIILKNIGADALSDIFGGRATWNNKGIAESVSLLQAMVMKGYFGSYSTSMDNEDIKSDFSHGEYAFYMNGSWNCSDFSQIENFEVGVGEFPVINKKAASSGQFIGGPSDTLAVSSRSKNASKAAAYAAELGQLICKYAYEDGVGLPAWNIDLKGLSVNKLTEKVAAMCLKADKFVLFGDTYMPGNEASTYLSYLWDIFVSTIDGQTFIKEMSSQIR